MRSITMEPALAEAASPPPLRPVPKWHYDRLSAAERWLAGRAGQCWREVEGLILRTFDTRSLAGRHVVFDHLLPPLWRVDREGRWRVHRRFEFRVDDDGRLVAERLKRKGTSSHWRWRCRREALSEGHLSCRAIRFVGDDRIGLRGHRAYWLHPTEQVSASIARCRAYLGRPIAYRQGRPLTGAERAHFDALGAAERMAIAITME